MWLQQDHIKEKIQFEKGKGTENPAGMNTKGLSGDEIDKYVKMLDMNFEEGRAELAPDLVSALHVLHCQHFNSSNQRIAHRVRFKFTA